MNLSGISWGKEQPQLLRHSESTGETVWDLIVAHTANRVNSISRGVMTGVAILDSAMGLGAQNIRDKVAAIFNALIDPLNLMIDGAIAKVNALLELYNRALDIAGLDEKRLNLIKPSSITLTAIDRDGLTEAQRAVKAADHLKSTLEEISDTDYAGAAFASISKRASKLAKDRLANDETARKAAEERDSARKDALDDLAKREDRLTETRMESEGRVIELIQRRLQEEHEALDEIGAEAIKNGADAEEINQRVANAKREAMQAANKEIYDYQEQLRDQAADEQERREREHQQRRMAEARLRDRTERFDAGLNRDRRERLQSSGDPNGGETAQSISGSPFAQSAFNIGAAGAIAGILEDEQSKLDEAQSIYAQQQEMYRGHTDIMVQITREFEARKAAIEQESVARQAEAMRQTVDINLSQAQTMFGEFSNLAASAFGEQSAAARAFLIAEQGVMIARATMALGPALMNALAAPFPLNLVQFATVAALGAQIISGVRQVSTAVQGREHGGPVSAAELYEVGEKNRPEILSMGGKSYMIPGNNGQVYNERQLAPANDRGGSGSGGRTINVNYNSTNYFNGVTHEEIMRDVDEKDRRQKEEIKQSIPAEIQQYEFDRGRGAS